jgi:hypothetical protein
MAIGTPQSIGTGTSTGVHSSNSLTTTQAILAGDLVVVSVSINSNSTIPTVSSMSDGTNSYSLAVRCPGANSIGLELWYCANALAVSSGAILTATWSGSNGGAGAAHSIAAARVAGITNASPVDKTSSGSASAVTSNSISTGTLSQPSEIVFGAYLAGGNALANSDPNFTNINTTSQSGNDGSLDYDTVSATTSVAYVPTFLVAAGLNSVIASFKGPQALTLSTGVGSYVLTGIAATLAKTKILVATAGSYALTGVAATLKSARHLLTGVGTYSVTGIAATIHKNWQPLVATAGSYALTGVAASLTSTRHLVATAGSYALTGVSAILKSARHLTAAPGSYVLTGVAIAMQKFLHLNAAVGSYTLTGVNLLVVHVIAPANKFRLRLQNYVLYTTRTTPPTLDD